MEQNMRIASYIYFSNTAPTDLTQLWAKPVGNDTYSLQIFNNGAWRPLVGSGGKSAYELAVEKGYSGTLEEWLLSLRGVQGNVGPQGEQGPQGPQGPQGEAGVSLVDISYSSETSTSTTYIMTFSDGSTFAFGIPKGAQGPKGDTGATGATGETGPKGEKGDKGDTGNAGTNGTNGIDGEDAYQPFKGWFDSSSDLESVFSSPEVGDYAYVMGATTSDPVAVYYCATAGTWTDSGYEFNPANNQEFLSGESLNTVRIVDDLTKGGAANVLSAKQGKVLDEKVAALGPKIDQIGIKTANDTTHDIIIRDENGYVIARFENGHFRTKNFYSGNVYAKVEVDTLVENAGSSNYWKNKFIEWDGDSISYGSWLTSPRQTAYPVLTASALGMILNNYAIGSSRLVKMSDDDYEDCFVKYSDWTAAVSAGTVNTSKQYLVYDGNSDSRPYQMYKYVSGSWIGQGNSATVCKNYPIVDRIKEVNLNADLFVIAAGTNDFYTNCPLGTTTDEVKTTFYGAMNIICKYLVQNTTNKNILFITPIKRYQGNVTLPDSPNTLGLTLKQYRDAIIERCDYYSIPVMDMWSVSGMNPSFNTALFADTDGKYVHPNEAGHQRMASFVIGYLKSLRS